MRRFLAALVLGVTVAVAGCKTKEQPVAAADGGPGAPAAGADTSGLVMDKLLVDGHLTEVAHSKWDGGRTVDLFDADPLTLARTENANPAILEIKLLEPRPLKGISLTTATMDVGLTATLRPQGGGAAKTYTKEFRQLPTDPTFDMDFDTGSTPIASLRVEVKNLNGGDGHIHLRTVKLE
jgi:hypothetical protein